MAFTVGDIDQVSHSNCIKTKGTKCGTTCYLSRFLAACPLVHVQLGVEEDRLYSWMSHMHSLMLMCVLAAYLPRLTSTKQVLRETQDDELSASAHSFLGWAAASGGATKKVRTNPALILTTSEKRLPTTYRYVLVVLLSQWGGDAPV